MPDYGNLQAAKQHLIDVIGAALDALGQDFNSMVTAAMPVVFNASGLNIQQGGASPNFSIANYVRYAINGQMYLLSPQASVSFSSALPVIPVASSAVFVVTVNAGAQVATVAGVVAAGSNATIPASGANQAAIGLIWVSTNGSVTFTPGVTNLDLPGLTVSYIDTVVALAPPSYPRLPTQPFTSAAALDAKPITPPAFNPQNF